jgi:hypothetical protein
MKRARNTLAARKSRQRKIQRFEELEDEIAKLEAERDHWENIALQRTSRQPKLLAKFSAISPTISRGNTSGEYAQRKMQRFEELEDKSAKLEAERDHWKNISLKRTSGQSKPLAKISAVSSTISRDNASGEYAQRAKLLWWEWYYGGN